MPNFECKESPCCDDVGFVIYRDHTGYTDDQVVIEGTGERILDIEYVRRFNDGQINDVREWNQTSIECPCQIAERKRRLADRVLGDSRLSPKFKRRTFERFVWLDPMDWRDPKDQAAVEKLVEGQRKAYQIVRDYAENYQEHGNTGQGFGLYGDPGVAKTHLLAAKTLYLLDKGIQSVFFNTVDLFSEIRSCFSSDEQGRIKQAKPSELIDLIKSTQDLSLDDIGTERPTDFVLEVFYLILNHRYEWELPTSFSTNMSDEELKTQLIPKTHRRLVEPCAGRCVLIKGPSFDRIISKLPEQTRRKYQC